MNYERDRKLKHNRKIGLPNFGGPLKSDIDTIPHYQYPEMPRDTTPRALPACLTPPEIPEAISVKNEGLVLILTLPVLRDRALSFHLQRSESPVWDWRTIKRDCGGGNIIEVEPDPDKPSYFRVLAIGDHGMTASNPTSSDNLVIELGSAVKEDAPKFEAEPDKEVMPTKPVNTIDDSPPPPPPPLKFPLYKPSR